MHDAAIVYTPNVDSTFNVLPQTSKLYEVDTPLPHAAYLLRLPPPSVALTPEVRCAVVGNVDSGKSTTLGVLTRGKLHW